MKAVLLANHPGRLSLILPVIDASRLRPTVADFTDPALQMSDFDCIVPFWLSDYHDLRRRPDFDRAKCLIPQTDTIELLDDKYECNRFLMSHGFGAFVPPMLDRVSSWPIIYKKKRDAWGSNSFLCGSQAELDAVESATVLTDYFKQEYIPGPVEYATHMLSLAGRVVYHSTYRYTFDTAFFVKGEWYRAPTPRLCDCPCDARLGAVISEIDYSGTACFNYKIVAGEPRIFEINPRFGHSLGLDINRYLDAYLSVLNSCP